MSDPESVMIVPRSLEGVQAIIDMSNRVGDKSTAAGKLLAEKYGFSYRRWRKGTLKLNVNFSQLHSLPSRNFPEGQPK